MVEEYKDSGDYDSFNLECIRIFGIENPVNEQKFRSAKEEDLIEDLFHAAQKHYHDKTALMCEQVFPVIRDVYTNPNNSFENIVTPFTDGIRNIQIMANLKKSYETKGRDLVLGFEKTVVLAMIDDEWKEHLRELDDLKQAVQNASLEQKDPLVIYKLESFNLFKDMIIKTNKEVISFLMRGTLPKEENQPQAKFTQEQPQPKKEKLVESRNENVVEEQNAQQKPKVQPMRAEQKINRNDPCPCGSGKKFKHCHGK
jgi:preprotein translocase subunit SecA